MPFKAGVMQCYCGKPGDVIIPMQLPRGWLNEGWCVDHAEMGFTLWKQAGMPRGHQ